MHVQTILDLQKGGLFFAKSQTSIAEAAGVMRAKRIGAISILDEESRLVGVLSERDIMWAVNEHGPALFQMTVDDIMTRDVITVAPTDELNLAAELMREHHIRHLPIVDGSKVCGMISVRDLFALRLAQLEQRNTALNKLLGSKSVRLSRNPEAKKATG